MQTGSDAVLKRMHREHTVEHYLGLLKKLRVANPSIVLSSDIIVGFPNETDEEYQMTLDLLDKAKYDFIYSYAFSPRAGTRAAGIEDFLTNDIKGERLRYLQGHQLKIQEKLREKMIGKTFRVLVEGTNTMKGETKWKGRTNCNRIVFFKGKADVDYKWHWVDLKVVGATALSCQGELVTDFGRYLN